MKPIHFEGRDSDLRVRLLLATMRAHDWSAETDRVQRLTETPPPAEELRQILVSDEDTAPSLLRRIAVERGAEWCELASYLRVRSRRVDNGLDDLSRLDNDLSDVLGIGSYVWPLLRCHQSFAAQHCGELDTAEYFLRDGRRYLEALDAPMLEELCTPNLEQATGCLARKRGDFKTASKSFHRALEIAKRHHLEIEPIAQHELAFLLWSSGQFQAALELHRDRTVRSRISKLLGTSWSIRSHLAAAKCAIDVGDAKIASKELLAAEQLLRESSGIEGRLPGYALLYSGELEILRGKLNPGLELIDKACAHFESMDPPFHAGLLDAKVSIAQHAISQKDAKRLMLVVHKLLEECASKSCMDARARLLVLESALFVSENPPLRAAFQDLVTRMHLIHNPALMLQALGNLYLYSIRFLDQPDQAFLMARLRRLQKVLDEGSFQDLYEKYIEKRYSWAIENRLAEFLEEEEKLLPEEEEQV